MRISLIRFFIFLSGAILNYSCSQYRHMQKIQSDESCVQKFKPDFDRVVYKTSADVTGRHISGLLFIKYMPDSSIRFLFSSEMGLSYFDFGFLPENEFRVYQITPAMNKKALIKTLRKDFELLMFRNTDSSKYYSLADSSLIYHAFKQRSGVNYYITDEHCLRLVKMQRASDKKPVMEAFIYGSTPGISPDSMVIRHLNFNFTISLKKVTPIAAQ